MNIAIEYVLRDGRIEQLLSLPCSLFLENKSDKVAITLHRTYGQEWYGKSAGEDIIVRNYILSQCDDSMMLPYKETIIKRADIFRHSDVIIPGYKILQFREQPYNSEEKQSSELPLSAVQEKQYQNKLKTFYSPLALNFFRKNWLWKCFNNIFAKNIEKKFPGYSVGGPDFQQDFLQRKDKATVRIWELWKRQLLLDSDPAAELVFAKYYKSEGFNNLT